MALSVGEMFRRQVGYLMLDAGRPSNVGSKVSLNACRNALLNHEESLNKSTFDGEKVLRCIATVRHSDVASIKFAIQ
jgi:hypothetical protein